MIIPTNSEILSLLARLDDVIADDLETLWLEIKPWTDPKTCMKEAVEYTACFANADGGVIVFGVWDNVRGRAEAIHGAKGYNLDIWRRGIYDSTRPNISVEVGEIQVPEGTGKLLIVRVPKGPNPPYGTAQGVYKKRIGKNCMPMDAHEWARSRISSGAIDWSAAPANGVGFSDLDPIEIARGRNVLRARNPESELLQLDDQRFLEGLGVYKSGHVNHAGLLLFGRSEMIADLCPQHQVHYVYQTSETEIARNDSYKMGLLQILEKIEQIFTGPINPEEELSVGLFKMRIPAFPLEVVREAVLNALTHRNYSDPNEVSIRHTKKELTVVSPGGFLGGITPQNILRHEPISRNKALAEAFEKLRLVERAGIGRRRIFIPTLSYGKRMPVYEADQSRVTLRIFDGGFDKRLATLVSEWRRQGREIDLEALLVLNYLRENTFIEVRTATEILQLPYEAARSVLDQLANPKTGILERKGQTKTATFHLTKGVAKDLLGKAAYTKTRGLNPARYAEMVRQFVEDHGSITPRECRELLGLGSSKSAQVEMSRYLKKWSASKGFLKMEGKAPQNRYRLSEGC